jgi:uncharacterized protein YndB with AHSA1/START domain
MIHAEDRVTISRPVDEVFHYVADTTNDPAWHTDLLKVERTSDGPIGVETTFRAEIRPFMGNRKGTLEVASYEPTREVQLTGAMGPMKPTITYRFASGTGGGTTVTRSVELQPPGLVRLMQPLIGGMFRKRNAQFLANLKRVLEAEETSEVGAGNAG